jgi:hypothetical protein
MSDLSYKDHCRITRSTGEYDEWDNPLIEEIYNGVCDFQPGGQTSLSIISHNDVVYLPKAVMVEENDLISVTTQLGRKREGVVKLANDLGLDLTGDWVTEIEIKQSTEK